METFQGDDLHDKRVKAVGATSKGINPLLILLLVCVVLTWGIAATLIFNLVDYKSMIDKSKNVQISEDDIKEAVGALYPFQYEAVRHPIKAVGQLLINIDDYITDVFSPRKDPYQLVDGRKPVPPNHPITYTKKKVDWAKKIDLSKLMAEDPPTSPPRALKNRTDRN